MNFTLLAVLVIVNIPVFLYIGKYWFDGWDGFWECVGYWIRPDILSALTGEFWDDWWGELKLALFLGVCAAVVYGEYILIGKFFHGP